MDALIFFLYFDFLRVCCRLCSCAMHAQGKETNEVRRLYVNFFITKFYTTINMVYIFYLVHILNRSFLMFRRLSSRTSRDSDAREEDCALGRTRISGIDRGWSRFMEASYIVIKSIDIY
jgi:hypothetical protein